MTGPWRSLLVLAAAVALVHGAAVGAPFQYDDHHSLVDNAAIRCLGVSDAGRLAEFFLDPGLFSQRPDRAMYRPLVLVSYALDYALGDGEPGAFHVTNLLLHLATAAVLLLLLRDLIGARWGNRRREGLSLAGALLFAVHPLTGEPAVYISARSESLAAILGLLSLWRLWRGGTWTSALLFAGALLARSTSIMLPVVAFCLVRALGEPAGEARGGAQARGWRLPQPLQLLPHVGIAVAYVAGVRGLLTRAMGGAGPPGAWDQVLTQLAAVPYLMRLLTVPHPLSVEHPLGGAVQAQVVHGVAVLLVASALLGSVVLLSTQARWLVLAALLPWLPVALIPLNAPISEHRLYLPAALAILGLVVTWGRRIVAPGWPLRATITLLLVLAGVTHLRGRAWASETGLWEAAVRVAPANPRAHFFLADVYRREGRPAAALRQYARADSLSGGGREIRLSRAGQLLAVGHAAQARDLLEPMARAHPEDGAVLYNLGLAIRGEDPGRAEDLFRAAWAARPDLRGAAMELSLCLEARGEVRAAAEVLEGGLGKHPRWAAGWVNLGFLRARLGDLAGARQAWEQAAALDPSMTVARDNLLRLDALERHSEAGRRAP